MIEKDDWRLSGGPLAGDEELIMDATLYYIPFTQFSESWDHEHCAFCFACIGENAEDLHSGYYTFGLEISKQEWICEKCFKDFSPLFKWRII